MKKDKISYDIEEKIRKSLDNYFPSHVTEIVLNLPYSCHITPPSIDKIIENADSAECLLSNYIYIRTTKEFYLKLKE